jgi:alkanesulfonate monooxygenase SsuD/methylene tetrahydromethanopterin reductase-like flavin-dependent oxidoreductase (luciferase family)
MEFGVFDHVDRNAMPLSAFYAMRLKIVEAYDRGGFRSYHIAEHHATPVGMAPSPGVFLAAVAQRTKRLRFGPLVYLLPLYHPVRLVEEICMLDQMSGGRLELGVGRGVSPFEVGYYGVDPQARAAMHEEALAIVKQGLTQRRIDFSGRFYTFHDVPMELEPFQKPMPPLWVGVERPDGAERAARAGSNAITAHPVSDAKLIYDSYRREFATAHPGESLPRIGLARFIVIADTDDEALNLARRAYPVWQQSLTYLARKHNVPTQNPRPPDFDSIRHGGRGIAGSSETVARELKAQLAEAGANYCVGQFAFGDLTLDEVLRTIDLFTREVMPALV